MKLDAGFAIATAAIMVVTASTNDISTDSVLRAWALTGALGGAVLSAVIGDNDKIAKRIVKFVASVVSGFIFAPAIMIYAGWPVRPDIVMGAAGFVAFVSWGILQVVLRLAPKVFKHRVAGLAAADERTEETP